jgi:hypothetical protein
MHVPINVKSPDNISKWHMEFNLAFKGLRAGFRLGKALQNNTGLYIQNVVGNYQQVFEVFVLITSQADVLKTRTTGETKTAVVSLPDFGNIVSAVSSNCKAPQLCHM